MYHISRNFDKGKVYKPGSNRQIKTNQYKAIAISASVLYFNLLYEHCMELHY